MESLKLLLMILYVAMVFVHVQSTVLIRFDQTPEAMSRHSYANFRYSFETRHGSDACLNNTCLVHCQLDDRVLSPCPSRFVALKNLTANRNHTFLVAVTTLTGDKNSTSFTWFIDTVPPTATITCEQNYTNAKQVTIEIEFSEACSFKCSNSSECDLIINGPGIINPNSLRIIKPFTYYELSVILSTATTVGRVIIAMAGNICSDRAGNHFQRTNTSSIIIHIDRRPVSVDFWASVPSYVLPINGIMRTVFATNNIEDLKFYLEFTAPVKNSTDQVLSALLVNKGSLVPFGRKSQGNRRFAFELNVTSRTQIITVELQSSSIIGRTGTLVSNVAPVTFLYDSVQPGVKLSTSVVNVTKESEINVIIEFTKPVFGFESSMINVTGGKITRLKELSRALYSMTVVALTRYIGSVTVLVPEGRVKDISGNLNFASNQLVVSHYSTPSISIALDSFMTAGILVTSVATALLSLSIANLGAIDSLSSASSSNFIISSGPSTNLHGMVGHLQVFVLSDWLSPNQPIEFSETIKGLRWLIPHQKLPWKNDTTSSVWPNHTHLVTEQNFPKKLERSLHNKTDKNQTFYCLTCARSEGILPKPGWFSGQYNMSLIKSPYGQNLDTREYFIYFLRGEPLSAADVVKRMENYKGWKELEMNLFWLGVGSGGLVIGHILLILFLKWRIGIVHGTISVPRFEIFLLILSLPCIAQASAFVIRGGTTGGIITGALLMAIPSAFILSICLFLVIAIFSGGFLQYKETDITVQNEPCLMNLWWFFTMRPFLGKWFHREGLPSSFLSGFGILFEALRGPKLDYNMEEDYEILFSTRLLGCARSSYIIVDLLRRGGLGILAGERSNRSVLALSVTSVQFVYLLILKPYIDRGVHIVECLSLFCEIVYFGLNINTNNDMGFFMLALLFVTFISQIVNEWYAIVTCVSSLSNDSLKFGLKLALEGLILPFLSMKHKKASATSSAMVPVLSPGLALPGAKMAERNARWQKRVGEGKQGKCHGVERRSELKKLRAMARASFSGDSKNLKEASTSYNYRL